METLNSAAGRIVESLQICQSALEFNEREVGGPIEPLSSHHLSFNHDLKSPKQDKSCIEFGLVEQGVVLFRQTKQVEAPGHQLHPW